MITRILVNLWSYKAVKVAAAVLLGLIVIVPTMINAIQPDTPEPTQTSVATVAPLPEPSETLIEESITEYEMGIEPAKIQDIAFIFRSICNTKYSSDVDFSQSTRTLLRKDLIGCEFMENSFMGGQVYDKNLKDVYAVALIKMRFGSESQKLYVFHLYEQENNRLLVDFVETLGVVQDEHN